MRRTLADEWASYEADVLPATAGAIQRSETRRGFYAGAHAMLQLLAGVGIDDISEDQGAAMIETWNQEIVAFVQTVKEGEA